MAFLNPNIIETFINYVNGVKPILPPIFRTFQINPVT